MSLDKLDSFTSVLSWWGGGSDFAFDSSPEFDQRVVKFGQTIDPICSRDSIVFDAAGTTFIQ